MIEKRPTNNEAGNIDDWNYNRGWNAAIDEMEKTMEPVYPDDKLVDEVVSYVIDVQAQSTEQAIQDKLIALGWMPPEQVQGLNEVSDGMKCLMKELVKDIKLLENEVDSLRQEVKRNYLKGWQDCERNIAININRPRPLRESELE